MALYYSECYGKEKNSSFQVIKLMNDMPLEQDRTKKFIKIIFYTYCGCGYVIKLSVYISGIVHPCKNMKLIIRLLSLKISRLFFIVIRPEALLTSKL